MAFQLCPRAFKGVLDEDIYWQLVVYIKKQDPFKRFHSVAERTPNCESNLIPNIGTLSDYVILRGYRYHAARRSGSIQDALALVRLSDTPGVSWVVQIEDIFTQDTPGFGLRSYVYVSWFRPLPSLSFASTPWKHL